MHLDVSLLARLQFAFTIMFHYIFPPLSIGLGALLVIMEATYLRTRDPRYRAMAKFWTRIFAVNFALGVATGIVMEFEFGTNWATYSRFVGDVFGSALAAEGIFAFFLESGFLAVLVFGWDKVSDRMHLTATTLVAAGALFSSVWIVVANSWQQTPAGFHIVGEGTAARAEITDFTAMLFNPSSVDRLIHVLIGSYILGAFFIMSISAYYLLRGRHRDFAQKTFFLGMIVGSVFSLAAPLSGHFQARTVAETQPAKLAAFEGLYETGEGGTELTLWGIVNEKEERIRGKVAVPGLLSFLVHDDFTTPVPGLDRIPPGDRPPVAVPFYTYRLMVGIGLYLVAVLVLAWFFYLRKTLFRKRWLLWVFVFSVLGPYLANQAGWVAAEVGRQPWIVYGLLRTSDGLSRAVSAEQVLSSIILFGVIYFLLFLVWVSVLNDKIQKGPEPDEAEAHTAPARGWIDAAAALGSGGSLTESGRRD